MTAEESIDIKALLGHDALLRRLAIRLAGESAGDDAVQETWLAVLRKGSLRAATAKAWLQVVVKRFVLSDARARARAERREALAGRRDAAASAAEIVEREATRREVIDALLGLEPIYRDVLLLRYESDLPPRKVAAALGIPTETARTRIKRGLAMMRQRLDKQLGPDRRRALAVLLPRVAIRASTATAAASIAAAALIAIVLLAALDHGNAPPPAPGALGPPDSATAAAAPAVPDAIRPTAFSEPGLAILDEREVAGMFPCAEPRDALGAHRFVATRMIDALTGAPVSGATLCVVDEGTRGETPQFLDSAKADADGWVRLPVEAHRERTLGTYWLAEGFAPGASSGAVPPFPIRLQKAGARQVRAVDVTGAPLGGVALAYWIGAARWSGGAVATTGADGGATLEGIDAAAGFVAAVRSGWVPAELALGPHHRSEPPAELVLLPSRACTGVVLRGEAPVAGARVWSVGTAGAVVTDAAGAFTLPAANPSAALSVSERQEDSAWSAPVTFAAPPPGRRCRLRLDSARASQAKTVRLICTGGGGARVPQVPLCIVSADGDVTRVLGDANGIAETTLEPGPHEVTTDDLAADAEAAPARLTIASEDVPSEIVVDVVERPRVTVSLAADVPDGTSVVLATDDASRDVTDAAPTAGDIPVPLRGRAALVVRTGNARHVREIAEPREPGAALSATLAAPRRVPPRAAAEEFMVEVRDGTGAPAAGASVSVEGAASILSAATDATGRAAFDAASIGAGARLVVRKDGFVPIHATVDPGAPARIAWPATSVAIVARGPDPRALPPPVVIVDGEPVYFENGIASIRGLAAGVHDAVVAAAGWIPKTVRFELSPTGGGTIEVRLRREP